MGRTETSKGLAPPAIRKDMRAKQARHIINKVIPALLASNGRARRGAESSELIVNPGPVAGHDTIGSKENAPETEDAAHRKRKGQGRRRKAHSAAVEDDESSRRNGRKRSSKLGRPEKDASSRSPTPTSPPPPSLPCHVCIVATDTLSAARTLACAPPPPNKSLRRKLPNVCILNMASPLRPGGGVLTGATSQEEFLCARTTLLPSLQESFYRLPELGGVYTPDVLVFRTHLPLDDARGDLAVPQRYYVDVISAGMLRFPELEGGHGEQGEEEEDEEAVKRLGKRDREMVEKKMRAVLRMAVAKGARKLVLGAWGCGAYGNSVADVAQAWRKILGGVELPAGARKARPGGEAEAWPGIEQVVFAIGNRKLAEQFALAYGDVAIEAGDTGAVGSGDEEGEGEDAVVGELRAKIGEMEVQLSMVRNPDLKERMSVILSGLRLQLKEREGGSETDDIEEGSVYDIGDSGSGGDRGGRKEDVDGDDDDDDDDESGEDVDSEDGDV